MFQNYKWGEISQIKYSKRAGSEKRNNNRPYKNKHGLALGNSPVDCFPPYRINLLNAHYGKNDMRIIFSTNNNGKLKEVREIFRDKRIANDNEVLSLGDIGIDLSPEETGKTYEENALIEAMIKKNLYRKDDMIIADDSGLSVDYLDGAPGIYSARFGEIKAGSQGFAPTNTGSQGFAPTDKCHYLLDLMKNADKENRKAKFICVLCVIIEEDIKFFTGEMQGDIAFDINGTSGFGYDPIFIPKGYNKTVAELTEDEKNKISHRAKALINFVDCVFKKC